MANSVGVLFVCMGNICRSPTGEGVFRHWLENAGLGALIDVDSAGTIAYHEGEPADRRMQAAAARRGYRLNSTARRVRPDDFDRFDTIIAMDNDNLLDLKRLTDNNVKRLKLRLLGEFINAQQPPAIPDPYYGGADGFEQVLDMIEAACPALLNHCKTLLEADSGRH